MRLRPVAARIALRRSAALLLAAALPARLDASPASAGEGLGDPSGPGGARVKGQLERTIEGVIQDAYLRYFRTFEIAGRQIAVRMPFGLDGERQGSPGYRQQFAFGGKGTPDQLWPLVEQTLASPGFGAYLEQLLEPAEQAVEFDLERRSVRISRDPRLLGLLERGPYPGTDTYIVFLRFGGEVRGADVYNYLYAVAGIGVDCSGFVYYIQKTAAASLGGDLDRYLGRLRRVRPERAVQFAGLSLYDPRNGFTERSSERIEDLRPGDVILFRGVDGSFKHSAVIQSVDPVRGLVRYVQSTDWAPEEERGVHESAIRFDPRRRDLTLRDPSLEWLQQVRPPFRGEVQPREWRNDGHRFLWAPPDKPSMVVRVKFLKALLLRRDPHYYENRLPRETELGRTR